MIGSACRVHDPPVGLLEPKDRRHPQLEGQDLLAAADLRLPPLVLHEAPQVATEEQGKGVVRTGLGPAVAELRRGPLHRLRHGGPSAPGRAPGVGQRDVVTLGPQELERPRVAPDDRTQGLVVRLDRLVEIHGIQPYDPEQALRRLSFHGNLHPAGRAVGPRG